MGELRLSGNHTVTEYEMSGKPYSQKSGLKNHTNERIFQVMARLWPGNENSYKWANVPGDDQIMTPSVHHIVILPHTILLNVAPFRLTSVLSLLSCNFPFIIVVTVRQIYRNNRTNCTVCFKSCSARSVGTPPKKYHLTSTYCQYERHSFHILNFSSFCLLLHC